MKDRILNTLMLLTVAAALVFSLLRGGAPEEEAVSPLLSVTVLPTLHPAESYRARRAETRRQEQALLTDALENPQLPDATRALAQDQLQAMLRSDEVELAVEAALAGQGYPQALCVCRGGALTIFTGQPLTDRDAALIFALAEEISGIDGQNIRVSGY
ncbi:MAG: SpoIIIAH-like family protein [Clostridia bacterium]|nr:SpoIIIAH-like family protein [Clostridia bacterium]